MARFPSSLVRVALAGVAFAITSVGGLASTTTVHDAAQLAAALERTQPGDEVALANGVWTDVTIRWTASGTAERPIVLRAETPGGVFLEGRSMLRLGGDHQIVRGLVFRRGQAPAGAVIEFRVDDAHVANDSRLTECVIDGFNPLDRFQENYWVTLYGRRNRVDHCYFGGKLNGGPLLVVRLNDERHRENHHRIDHNYFGERPRLGSNGGETIRVGVSTFCQFSSNTLIEENFFEHCSGEVEIVSIKSCDNVIRGNTFWGCEGVLALRHGDRNLVEGNFFLGRGRPNTGGVRVINESHVIRNNHFQDLTGERFFGTLPVMDGVFNSAPNRYMPVKNVRIEGNRFFQCAPIAFGVGMDNERTVPPAGCRFVDNLIVHDAPEAPFVAIDDVSGVSFSGNRVRPAGDRVLPGGFEAATQSYTRRDDGLFAGGDYQPHLSATRENCGPAWYQTATVAGAKSAGRVVAVEAKPNALAAAVEASGPGDILELAAGAEYPLARTLTIARALTLRARGAGAKPVLRIAHNTSGVPIITLEGGAQLTLEGLRFDGLSESGVADAAIATADHPMIEHLDLSADGCDFVNFNASRANAFVMAKSTFADTVSFTNCRFEDISGFALSLHAEWEDKGRYNAEHVILRNCFFKDVMFGALDLYRGGNDESTTGPFLRVEHCTFVNTGNMELGSVLLLVGVQDGDVRNCLFVDSGRSGRAVKMEDPRWCRLLVSHCNLWRAGRIESYYPDRQGPALTELEPAFVAPDEGNFSLQPGSRLSGAGSDGRDVGALWQDGELAR